MNRINYTQISNYFIDNWDELGFTLAEKAIMEKWFRGQPFYVWHDSDLGKGISEKTVQRWRTKMYKMGYCKSFTLIKEMNEETNLFYTKGYRYDFSPLIELLNIKDGNIEQDTMSSSHDVHELDTMSNSTTTVSNSIPSVSTHTNTIINTIYQDYNNTADPIIMKSKSKAELIAPVTGQQHLNEEQEELIKEWNKLDIIIRKGDIKNLLNFTSTKKYIPLVKYWKEFCLQDEYYKTKDFSFTLFLNSYYKLSTYVSNRDQLSWPLFVKKHHISSDEIDQYENLGQAKQFLREKYNNCHFLLR
jgi:hypothetical protein